MGTLPMSKQISDVIAHGLDVSVFHFTKAEQETVDQMLHMLAEKERMCKPFRFVDLPAEIRNRVYSLTIFDENPTPLNLTNFASPAIARVSRQLRSETLPILFAEAHFDIMVGATLTNRGNVRLHGPTPPRRQSLVEKNRTKSGCLKMKRSVQKFLTETNAVLRNVNIHVIDAQYVNTKSGQMEFTACASAVLRLGYEKGSACITAENGRKHLCWQFGQEDVDAHIDPAKEEAEKIVAGRKDFKGFTLSDIRKIAKHLRLA